jgi:hypothetical protein
MKLEHLDMSRPNSLQWQQATPDTAPVRQLHTQQQFVNSKIWLPIMTYATTAR